MNATQKLYDAGQSLWLDNITRDLLTSGALKRYIDELAVTGLTSNPTFFDHAIKNSGSYDAAIRERLKAGKSGENLFFEIALEESPRRRTCSGRSMNAPRRLTAGSCSKCRRSSPTTPRRQSPKPRTCIGARVVPTSSSRFPARRRGCPRSRRRSSRAFRST